MFEDLGGPAGLAKIFRKLGCEVHRSQLPLQHAQPALLYLVPACLGAPLFMALVRGDIKSMLKYADHPEEEKEDEEPVAAVSSEKKKDKKKDK